MKTVIIFSSIYSLILGLFISGFFSFNEDDSSLVSSVNAQEAKALESCKFYRNDQQSVDCPPSAQGFRCEQSLEFKSTLLLSYIKGASEKTKVPQEVLAAFVRVESTVPLKYSSTKKSYSISDYTDDDVKQMKNPISSSGDIDATIGNTSKASCPRSSTGALGIMQIQPPQQVHDTVRTNIIENNKKRSTQYDVPAADQPSKSTPGNIDAAARAIGKTKDTLTVDDFCDPQKSLIMASHVFFGKMGMNSWNPPKDAAGYETFINELARLYYGNDAQTGAYGNSVWRSVSSCQGGTFSGQTSTTSSASAPTVSCPVPNGKISFNSYEGGKGHCGPGYGFDCNCGTKGRRAKAIDVKGGDPVLPQIEGESVNWTYLISYTVEGGEGGGKGHTFRAKKGADSWYLDILHLSNSPLTEGKEYPSGTKIGAIDGPHAHLTVGKNLKTDFPRAATESDCDPGWMPSEFVCDGSTQPTTGTGGGSGTASTVNSNKFCTKVGNPTEPNPCPVSGPTGPFPYYCQGDSKWDNGGGCGMGQIGCGPTSTAMIFSYYGDTKTPKDMYDEFVNGELINCVVGTSLQGMLQGKTWFKERGYEVGPDIGAGGLNATEAKKYIDEGWLLFGSTDAYKGTDISHIFVIQDINPTAGTFTIRDPANCDYGPGTERAANIEQPIRGGSFIPSWKYAYPVRKIGYTPTAKNNTTTGSVDNSNKAFPVSGWTAGVKLHWDEDTGGADFPPEKPANANQWEGTVVVAVEDSVVEEVNGPDYKGPGGNYVQLKGKASNLSYYYAHLKERSVEQGKEVKKGERIGSIGMTGNAAYAHLHLGVGPEISYGAGAKGGVGNYNAVGMLCSILNKPLNARGDCR